MYNRDITVALFVGFTDKGVDKMKKLSILTLIGVLCFSMLQFWHPISTALQVSANARTVNDSVIQNGGFEQGLAGWAYAGAGLLNVTDENAHSGNYSLKTSSSIDQQAYFYQYLDFPNASFAFSFWIFRVDPGSWTACCLDRDWDGNTARVVSSLVIQDDTIELNAWDNPYAPGRQVFNYTVTIGVWHNVTFAANATSGTQDFYIDGNLIETLNSSSGNVFGPDVLIFGDVSNEACNGTFYFDDLELEARERPQLEFSLTPNPAYVGQAVNLLGNLTDSLDQPINNTKIEVYVNGTLSGTLFTNSSGWFATSAKVSSAGTYNVTVVYNAENYGPSNYMETLIVYLKFDTKVSFTLSPNPVNVGKWVRMSGNLTDIHDNLIGNAPLELYVKTDAGPWQYIGNISTDSSGRIWAFGRVMSVGIYQVAVLYRGSFKYNLSYHIETYVVNP